MSILTETMPLHKIVADAMVDSYMDISQAGVQQTFSHWCSRGLEKLTNEVLKTGIIKVLLPVNSNTHTAALPLGFKEETFVGEIRNGKKYSIVLNSKITDEKGIETLECEDKCPKCNANKAICQDLQVTEDTVLVVINDSTYEQTIIKKLYPDGSYYLETTIPVLNLGTNTVEYTIQKEFIATISLKPCGCIEETETNIATIQTCCPDVYCCYFAPCCQTNSEASYRIFEDTGLIQLKNFHSNQLYMEYRGFMAKKNGVWQVPRVCRETLVEYTKFKAIDGKPNIPLSVKNWRLDQYKRERSNMNKVLFRTSLSNIIFSSLRVPKFDWYVEVENYCNTATTSIPVATVASDCSTNNSTTCAPTANKTQLLFDYAGIVGIGNAPLDGSNSYQNVKFKNAIGINFIIIQNQIYSLNKGEFEINTDDGIISLTNGNTFIAGDSLIVPTFSKLL